MANNNQEKRRVTYRLYPTEEQQALLFHCLNKHRHLYNALLEQRISIYRQSGKSISFAFQCKEITDLRHSDPEYKAINAQSLQVTSKRLENTYDNFFQRIAAGDAKPGFPRFKSRNRFTSFGYKAHGDGWKLTNHKSKGKKRMRNGNLHLSGIGKIKIRGASNHEGLPKTCDIMHKAGAWYASVVIEPLIRPSRITGLEAAWPGEAGISIRNSESVSLINLGGVVQITRTKAIHLSVS